MLLHGLADRGEIGLSPPHCGCWNLPYNLLTTYKESGTPSVSTKRWALLALSPAYRHQIH